MLLRARCVHVRAVLCLERGFKGMQAHLSDEYDCHVVFPQLPGDYDSRTPLHLAAAEGQDKAVQYLIAKGADVNFKDRWGATALQDAVTCGHVQVAEQILSRGGVMTTALGAVAMCNAATEGDVRYLKLLIRCGMYVCFGFFVHVYFYFCRFYLAAAVPGASCLLDGEAAQQADEHY
jgi:hypothetical protein